MWKGEGGKIEIVPVGAAWKATKANCRVFLTDLRDFLAVSLGDVLEKCATSRAFWLQLRVDRSLIILVSQICLLVSWEFHISVLWLCSWLLSSHLAKQFWSPKFWKRKKGSWSPLEFWAVLINWMNQYFSCNIRKEICSLITYQTLCQTVIAYFQNGSVKEKKKNNQKNNMAAEPLLRSWRAKPSIDPSGSEDTVMSPLHLSVILSASNDLAVRSGESWPAWCCFVSNVQLLLCQSVPGKNIWIPCLFCF